LGCPKNAVDSDRMIAALLADGLEAAGDVGTADVVVVNTCAFIEAARQESVDTLLALADARKPGAKLVATGCLAERAGAELAAALPEADAVVGFAGEASIAETVGLASRRHSQPQSVTLRRKPTGVRDLLDLPRPAPRAPWSYVKVAEGCDRACAFCAIPTFRGKQASQSPDAIGAEARALVEQGVRELVLVAQDLAWYGRDGGEPGALVPLLRRLDALRADGLARIRLLYLYPSEVRDPLVATMLELPSVVPYFDLSLQHASRPLLARMKRWGSGDRFLATIDRIRAERPEAAFRSSFISGFPGETEAMHEELLAFVAAAELDWAGFFAYSREDGTAAATLDGVVPRAVTDARLAELTALQEPITRERRAALVGNDLDVLVDGRDNDSNEWIGRTHREAPEIDGVIRMPAAAATRAGEIVRARAVDVDGFDLVATAAPTMSTARRAS
jgi:ribosomal protein S12 methylthiotransferase